MGAVMSPHRGEATKILQKIDHRAIISAAVLCWEATQGRSNTSLPVVRLAFILPSKTRF